MQEYQINTIHEENLGQLTYVIAENMVQTSLVDHSVKRYLKPEGWMAEEIAVLNYTFNEKAGQKIELRFCITGNTYCKHNLHECNTCKLHKAEDCAEKLETVDFISFSFSQSYVEEILSGEVEENGKQLLPFSTSSSFSRSINLSSNSRVLLNDVVNSSYSAGLGKLYVNSQGGMLLLQCLHNISIAQKETLVCKFLNNEADREKIVKARDLLLEHICDPITIKQLSRKVAINECYLKKGFKEMFGATVFEFYQEERMKHAKSLLYDKGFTVTEVSALLGYSSISHFSTAFKRHTGLKPCDLLMR